MKKHSWIVALLVALSFTALFISCGEDADEFVTAVGIKAPTIEGQGDLEIDEDVITFKGGSSLLIINLKSDITDEMTIEIEYTTKLLSGSGPKIKLATSGWGDAPGATAGVNIYPDLKLGLIDTLKVPGKAYGSGKIVAIQSLSTGTDFQMKILSVKQVE